jgi:hypothetical protein
LKFFSAWIRERRTPLPSLVDLKVEIDSYMDEYDTKMEGEKRKAKEMEGIPDEDGWTTVTRVGKKRGIRQEDVNGDEAGIVANKRNAEKVPRNSFQEYLFRENQGFFRFSGTRRFLSIPNAGWKDKTSVCLTLPLEDEH